MKKVLLTLAITLLMCSQAFAQLDHTATMNFEYINPGVPKADYHVFSNDHKYIGADDGFITTPIIKALYMNNSMPMGINIKEKIIGFIDNYAITANGKMHNINNPQEVLQIGEPNTIYRKMAYDAKADEYWVVGDKNSYIRGNGKNWTVGTIPLKSLLSLTAVAFHDGVGFFGTREGKIICLKNGKWFTIASNTDKPINSLAFRKDGVVLAACGGGEVLIYDKSFGVFFKNTLPHKEDANDIFFKDENVGVVACDKGYSYYTFDGGKSWFEESTRTYTKSDLNAVTIIDGEFHIVGDDGAYFIREKDQSMFIKRDYCRFTKNINDAIYYGIYPESELYQYCFVADDNTLFTVAYKSPLSAYRTIHYTLGNIEIPGDVDLKSLTVDEGGALIVLTENNQLYTTYSSMLKKWENLNLKAETDLNKVRFYRMGEEYIGFLVGNKGTILRSTDNARTWEKINTPTNDDLNHITLYKGTLYVIGENGCVLRSEDKGITWYSLGWYINTLLPNNVQLKNIDFDNFGVGKDIGLIFTGSMGQILFYSPDDKKAKLEQLPTQSDVTSFLITKNNNCFAFCENGEMFYKTYDGTEWQSHIVGLDVNINNIMYFEQPEFNFSHCLGKGGTIMNRLEMSSSVLDEAKPEVKIFPHPATDYINIELSDIEKIELYDVNNRFIKSLSPVNTNNTTTANIDDIPVGAYLLKVFSPRGIDYIKFMKN